MYAQLYKLVGMFFSLLDLLTRYLDSGFEYLASEFTDFGHKIYLKLSEYLEKNQKTELKEKLEFFINYEDSNFVYNNSSEIII